MSAYQQQELLPEPEVAEVDLLRAKVTRYEKNMRRLLQEVGNPDWCNRNIRSGGAGCRVEVFFVKVKGPGETPKIRCLNPDCSTHVCKEEN